jgi:hypothetical protein
MFSSPLHPNYPFGTISSIGSPTRPDVPPTNGITSIDKENNNRRRENTQLADGVPVSPLGDITESSFLNAKCRYEQSTPKQLLTPDTTPPIKRVKREPKPRSCQEGLYSTSLVSAAILEPNTALRTFSLPRRLFVRELTLRCSASRRFYSRADFSKYELQTYCSTAVHDAYVIQELTGLRQSIPFSVTSCRQHSISAVGGEDGIVHVLDTDINNSFRK